MKFSLDDLKKLRAETSAGVSDVRQALEDASGDYEKAKKLMQSVGELSSAEILRTLKQIGFIVFIKNLPYVTAEGIDFLNMRLVSESVDD